MPRNLRRYSSVLLATGFLLFTIALAVPDASSHLLSSLRPTVSAAGKSSASKFREVHQASNQTPASPASVFTVINNNDSGPGSLRQAILDANSNAGADTISL